MGYLSSMGDGDMTVTVTSAGSGIVFNSTKYPGVCKPSNPYTLSAFQNLQQQLNRVAQVRGLTKISIDGDIGPGTVALANKALGAPSSCVTIAQNVLGYIDQAKIMANAANAPATVAPPSPPAKPPTLVLPNNVEVPAPTGISASVQATWGGMTTPMKLAAVGILGGIGYFVWKGRRR